MHKLLSAGILVGLLLPFLAKAQCFDRNKIIFPGSAPVPWRINGLVNDWVTILGQSGTNNQYPYNPPISSASNYSRDPMLNQADMDHPLPATDIRFTAFTQDDYNVYFYLRRPVKTHDKFRFLYFCDINADGFMNAGEPVISGRFDEKKIKGLAIYRFIPDTAHDYVAGKGNRMTAIGSNWADGYTIKGSMHKLFSSHHVPGALSLGPHEDFDADVTENGYGIELAVPWKFLKNWVTQSTPLTTTQVFTYHISTQRTGGHGYNPQRVDDNAGSCCRKSLYSSNPSFDILGSTYTSPAPRQYDVQVTLRNPTNLPETFLLNTVTFSNLQLVPGIPFSPGDFSVTVNGLPFDYQAQPVTPITYLPPDLTSNLVLVQPFSSTTFNVHITLPANGAVSGVSFGLIFSDAIFSAPQLQCSALYGGGGGSHPVLIEVTTENFTRTPPPATDEPEPVEKTVVTKPVTISKTAPAISTNAQFNIYPNPSSGTAWVVLPYKDLGGELRVEDLSGKLVWRKVNLTATTLTLDGLRPGFYIVRYINGNPQKQLIRKLIIQ